MIIGLVGKPNVGKSTFFKASTLANVEIANYPFTTIQSNQGIGYVRVKCPEADVGKKCKPKYGYCIDGERFVPVKLVDVAGLVPEAHKGKGKGNEFLDDLREADCLIHILDASGKTDAEGNLTENYDVTKDVEFLEYELVMWIKQILSKNWTSLERKATQTSLSSEITQQLSGLKIKEEDVKDMMKELELSERGSEWSEEDLLEFAKHIRAKSKPIIIAANKSDMEGSEKNIEKLKKKFSDLMIIPCSADSELALREASKGKLIEYTPGDKKFDLSGKVSNKQKQALDNINKILKQYKSTGVQACLNNAVFDFLKYIVVYPVENENKLSDSKGNILPDAILLPSDSTTLDLAYAIHTDIGDKFVGAVDAKTKKKLGKESKLKDGDIIKILTK